MKRKWNEPSVGNEAKERADLTHCVESGVVVRRDVDLLARMTRKVGDPPFWMRD